MPAFLEKLSKQIYAEYKEQLGDLCIVLPNRRAALFIRKYLGGILTKTSFLPTFYSIEDFVTRSSGLQIADNILLQFMLYEIHKEIEQENIRNIDEFLPYAGWMLSDFNDIDMYLADAGKLFTYLSDAKAITLWNLDGSSLSDMEKRYLEFFRSLGIYYDQLKIKLKNEQLSFQGMAFRSMAENIESFTQQLEWGKVVFAGFNALTTSEERIISHLLNTDKANIYWDSDQYYTRNRSHEAGEFLRRNFSSFKEKEIRWEEDNFSGDKDIQIIGIPKNTGQAKYAGEIISNITDAGSPLDNVAVVLPDEALLIPLLNSIPEEAGAFNITMGLPLSATPLFNLFDNILWMHQNADRYQELKENKNRTYFVKDLIKIFDHPWIQLLTEEMGEPLSTRLRKSQKIFIRDSEIPDIINADLPQTELIQTVISNEFDPPSILTALNELLLRLRSTFIEKRKSGQYDFTIEIEYLFQFQNLLKKFQGILDKYKTLETTKTFRLIFRQLANQQRIPFYGEPLQGLQVMGMLETRTLDFETLIILSMNEGILPSSNTSNTFIPFDIKKQFGLPTYKDNNAVFAYHFYRLIQRAKKIHLLYNTEAGDLGGEEKSRFIFQLLNELKRYNPRISIKEDLLSIPAGKMERDSSISIPKDENVMKLLKEEAQKGFHPSSLALFINCPLQFYFSRLIKLEESEEPEDTIDNRILGIVIHESLKNLLQPYIGQALNKEGLSIILQKVSAEIKKQFLLAGAGADISSGKNHLIADVAEKMLRQMIKKEIQWMEYGHNPELVNLEKSFTSNIKISLSQENINVKIRGTIDRIDRKGTHLRILDYKTGYVDQRQLNPGKWEKLFTDPNFSKAFQLLLYTWLYDRNQDSPNKLQAGVISLRAPGNGPVELIPPDKKELNRNLLDEFTAELQKLLAEILNNEIPFSQTTDENRCKYCTFKEICNRASIPDKY